MIDVSRHSRVASRPPNDTTSANRQVTGDCETEANSRGTTQTIFDSLVITLPSHNPAKRGEDAARPSLETIETAQFRVMPPTKRLPPSDEAGGVVEDVPTTTNTTTNPTQSQVPPPTDGSASVFAELDAFASANDNTSDGMLMELASAPDAAEWGLGFDGLNFLNSGTPDNYPALPNNFMELSQHTENVPAPPPPTPQVTIAQRQHAQMQMSNPFDEHLEPAKVNSSMVATGDHTTTVTATAAVVPQDPSYASLKLALQEQLKPTAAHNPAFVPGSTWPAMPHTRSRPTSASATIAPPSNSTNQSPSLRDTPGTPRRASSSNIVRMRSPGSSTSSAPGKSRVPTAVCTICGKSISANGANFRRHVQACRRQRTERGAHINATFSAPSPLPTPLLQPAPGPPPTTPIASAPAPPPAAAAAAAAAAAVAAAAWSSPPTPYMVSPYTATQAQAASARRDTDLMTAVQRLERSISTLDVSARLCLRDALLSLSNKAANPHVMPTPEQEAMNRAAEYLVLRMLFLSGQQVMHTAPGTAGAYSEPAPQVTPTQQPTVTASGEETTTTKAENVIDTNGGGGGGNNGNVETTRTDNDVGDTEDQIGG